MSTKPTLILTRKVGRDLFRDQNPTPYTPIKLALHKSTPGGWAVSDIESGLLLCFVEGSYKGMPVSSDRMSLREIKPGAELKIALLIERVGVERFRKTLEEGRALVRART